MAGNSAGLALSSGFLDYETTELIIIMKVLQLVLFLLLPLQRDVW